MGEREVGGDWGQIKGMLLAWVLWEPQWHREGRVENWLSSLCYSGCSAYKATPGHLSSLGWCLSWEQCGQRVGVLQCSELQG